MRDGSVAPGEYNQPTPFFLSTRRREKNVGTSETLEHDRRFERELEKIGGNLREFGGG